MLSVKALIDKVEKLTGSKVQDFENVYKNENPLTSRSNIENEFYVDKYIKPLLKTVDELGGVEQVNNYMMFKHGLERNEVFAKRDSDRWKEDKLSKLDKNDQEYDDKVSLAQIGH